MDNFTTDALLRSEAFVKQLEQAEVHCGRCRTTMTVKAAVAVGTGAVIHFACPKNANCQQLMLELNAGDLEAFAKEGKLVLPLRITLVDSQSEAQHNTQTVQQLMQMRGAIQQAKSEFYKVEPDVRGYLGD